MLISKKVFEQIIFSGQFWLTFSKSSAKTCQDLERIKHLLFLSYIRMSPDISGHLSGWQLSFLGLIFFSFTR